jgi:hypothetical protein
MILTVKNPVCDEVGKIKELTIDDFRSMSFIVENATDLELEEFLTERLIGKSNALTKLLTLIQARMQFVSEQITFNNGTTNVNIDLKFLLKELINNVKSVKRSVVMDDFTIDLDYPSRLIHTDEDDLMLDCITAIHHSHKQLDFRDLDQQSKLDFITHFNAKAILKIREELEDMDTPITIFKARANLADITLSLFDNSSFVFIRALFSYYTYDEITELIFMLSKRLTDLQYLNSRTPRDLELFIRLYSEEIEKASTETKS